MSKDRRFRAMVRVRRFFRQLSGIGGLRRLGDAYRVLLLVSAAIFVDLAFPGRSSAPDLPRLGEGMVAEEDIIASSPFDVYKSDTEMTRERAEAAGSVSPIFNYRPQMADSAAAEMREFFAILDDSIAAVYDSARLDRVIRRVLDRYRVPASDAQAALLASEATRRRLARAVESSFQDLLRDGVANSNDLGVARNAGVIVRHDSEERLVPRDSVTTMQEFFSRAATRAPLEAGGATRELYQNLIIRFAESTIRPDREATETARDQARQAVNPIKYEVLEGERIVAAHERVGSDEVERLRAYADALAERNGGEAWESHVGVVLYNLALLLIFALALRFFWPEVYSSQRSATLLWVLLAAVAVAAATISRTGAPPELIPIAFAALIVASLYDGLLALVTVFLVVALISARLLGMVPLVAMSMGGAVAALCGHVMQRRAQTWAIAGVIAGAYVLVAVSLGLINGYGARWVIETGAWGLVNGIGSTIIAVGILPLAESFTKITTDQSLLELADVNRPLLRRLSLEAPGTYAHSVNVANLAEAAAREIDANSLLVRVGTYYHDIGKVRKPQFFVENQPPGRNPHDKLKPTTSVNIIREHVNEGLEMAGEGRLPDVVKAFISEHHGTQRIGFFLEKAKELEPDTDFDPDDFRYPGPKPQSKETAILLLADSVESATRALQDPTPERISELVDRIVGFKIAEGQLDEAPLTLGEISTIKAQFVKVLSGMYHHRLDYPAQSQQPTVPRHEPAARGTP